MPSYTYNNDIPDGPNNPSVDQPKMKVNTQSIASILGGDPSVDMIGFGDVNGGWHRKITYVDQGSDATSAAGQYVAYSKFVTSSVPAFTNQSELFLKKDGNATLVQLTAGYPNVSQSGHTYLPGGIILQWAYVTSGNSVTWDVTFPNACWGAVASYNFLTSAQALTVSSITTTGAVLGGTGVRFVIAIGN